MQCWSVTLHANSYSGRGSLLQCGMSSLHTDPLNLTGVTYDRHERVWPCILLLQKEAVPASPYSTLSHMLKAQSLMRRVQL